MLFEQYRQMQKKLTLNGQEVAFVDVGAGEPLLLIHGIPVWGYLWKDCIEGLAGQFRLIIPDLLGYGYSDKRDAFDRAVTVQAGMLKTLLDELGISPLCVVGHDIGGAVAQRLVVAHPEQVRKLMLIDSVLYDSWPAPPMVKLGDPQNHYRMKGDQLAKKFIERLPAGIHHKEVATAEMLQGWMAPYSTDEGKLSLIRNAAALNTNHTMEILSDLKQLSMPKRLLWGEKDPFQPIAEAEKFAREMPACDLVRVPDSDHFLPFEKPDEVARHRASFCG